MCVCGGGGVWDGEGVRVFYIIIAMIGAVRIGAVRISVRLNLFVFWSV